MNMASTQRRIVIIGCGFAGLSAARTLTAQSDCQVVLLEASDAVGGRARGAKLPSGTPVELGATWFHGVRDNPVYDMAVWQGVVKDIRCDPEAQKHDIDWQLHFARPLETQLLSGELNGVAMEAVGRYTDAADECTQGAHQGDGSIGDVLRRTFDEAVASEGLQGEALQAFADTWHFREKLQRTFDGFFSTDDVSLAFAREYETLEGPNMPVPGGYQALAEILAQGLDIHYNHRVTRIEYGPQGVTVCCENGATFDAHCVLVTTSLGVLQSQHEQLFYPPLPQWKVDAMSSVRIGVADKLFIEFEIEAHRARDAAAWLTSHANLSTSSPVHHNGTPQQPHQPHHEPQSATTSVATLPHASPEHVSTGSMEHGRSASSPGWRPPASPALTSPSPQPLPTFDVSALLPPTAIGGLPEPWNLGRRPSPQLWPAPTPVQQLLHYHQIQQQQQQPHQPCLSEDSTNTTLHTGSNNEHRSSFTGNRAGRRRKHKRTIHSYAFLWPVKSPMLLGSQGHPALLSQPLDARAAAICLDDRLCVLPNDAKLHVPDWLHGLHSVRYCPGPEWIEPSLLQEATDVSLRKRTAGALAHAERRSPTVNLLDGGATHVSGVLWITGDSAVRMEAASEEEVVEGVATLFKMFPQVPVPPGAIMPPRVVRSRWGTDPLFMGSYSYVNVTEETGEVVDAIAEPLCNDEGVPIVLFAGEATYRPCIGTVHGAFLSGCREAERILDMLRPQSADTPANSSIAQGCCSPGRDDVADMAAFERGHELSVGGLAVDAPVKRSKLPSEQLRLSTIL